MYHSDQHTKCALCGIDKHTPLRTWDGYVCLTCIDKLLHQQHDIIETFKKSKGIMEKINSRSLTTEERKSVNAFYWSHFERVDVDPNECDVCNGSGQLYWMLEVNEPEKCYACNGTGRKI